MPKNLRDFSIHEVEVVEDFYEPELDPDDKGSFDEISPKPDVVLHYCHGEFDQVIGPKKPVTDSGDDLFFILYGMKETEFWIQMDPDEGNIILIWVKDPTA